MTTQQAINLAATITQRHPKVDRLLRAKCRETGRARSFIIMRFGDPREWGDTIPKGRLKPLKVGKQRFRTRATYRAWAKTSGRKGEGLRRCVLQHITSGRIIRASSIVAFCRKARLTGNARFHITPILDGQRLSYKDWFLPSTLATKLNLRDVYGNVYKGVTIREWVKKHGLSAHMATKLLRGDKTRAASGRLALASTEDTGFIKPRSTIVTGVTLRKGGHIIKADSLPSAAARLGLYPSSLYPLAYGVTDTVAGYKLTHVKTEQRMVLKRA